MSLQDLNLPNETPRATGSGRFRCHLTGISQLDSLAFVMETTISGSWMKMLPAIGKNDPLKERKVRARWKPTDFVRLKEYYIKPIKLYS